MTNIENLTKLRDFMATNPNKVRMVDWYGGTVPAEGQDIHFCDSTACAAGWGAVFAGWKPEVEEYTYGDVTRYEFTGDVIKDSRREHPAWVAANWLDIDIEVGDFLFYDTGDAEIVPMLDYLLEHPDADYNELDAELTRLAYAS